MEPVHDSLLSHKTVGRLSLYRRLLQEMLADGQTYIFSRQIAAMTGGTGAQVRRDMMVVGYTGSPIHGYTIRDLLTKIGEFLDTGSAQKAALVGIGNLGRALLSYFSSRNSSLAVVAAFDVDPSKANRVIGGCRCYPAEMLAEVLESEGIEVVILAVPAQEAQPLAELLYAHGVRGMVNFAPVHLRIPEDAFVEQIDLTMALDKAAFFARSKGEHKEMKS